MSDEEILAGMEMPATTEGVFTETAGGVLAELGAPILAEG